MAHRVKLSGKLVLILQVLDALGSQIRVSEVEGLDLGHCASLFRQGRGGADMSPFQWLNSRRNPAHGFASSVAEHGLFWKDLLGSKLEHRALFVACESVAQRAEALFCSVTCK